MTLLIVLNRPPYDGTDVTWNALRLAGQSLEAGLGVRIFLMNDSIDLAREDCRPPEGGEDLQGMLRDLVARGAEAKFCKTCLNRCGISRAAPIAEVVEGTMPALVEWIAESERILSF
jgi:uncharacterized protein involved in oxidation of intracellular sulfur